MLNIDLSKLDQTTYTKLFLKEANMTVDEVNVKQYSRLWWKNFRKKGSGGLRLSDQGLEFVKETLDLKIYQIPFPITLDLKPEVIIFLDRFIDCPYHLTEDDITVLSERKFIELHLFSGDVRKYGLIKAMKRESPKFGKTF
jgi:hypothetical protein